MTAPTGSKEEMEGVPELPCGAKIAASESGSPVEGLTVEFLSHNRPPRCAPNPDFPAGTMTDMADPPAQLKWGEPFRPVEAPTCLAEIPYPAECCGIWIVACKVCGWSIGLTAAGRVDDVRRVRLPCRLEGRA